MDKRKQRLVQDFINEIISGTGDHKPDELLLASLKELADFMSPVHGEQSRVVTRLRTFHRRAELLQSLIGGS